jgi:hypothetical protein
MQSGKDPGKKIRSGGYKRGATTPRGKALERKQADRRHDEVWKKFAKQYIQPRNTRASQPKRKGGRRK